MLVPLVYLAVVAIQRAHPWRPAVVAGIVLAGLVMYQGGTTYLAWFDQLGNAGKGPAERRPDLTAILRLTVEQQVPGGALYRLTARDAERCPAP